jgi:hypothetical protein
LPEHRERIPERVKPLVGLLVPGVYDPPVRLHQDGGAKVAVRVPPVGRAGGGAAGAHDALVQAVLITTREQLRIFRAGSDFRLYQSHLCFQSAIL